MNVVTASDYQVLLAIGGWSGESPTNAVEAYDPRAETWLNVSTIPGIVLL